MKSLAALAVFVAGGSMSSAYADEAWFEGRWMWDEEASIESMTEGHPYSLACDTDESAEGESVTSCVTLRERLGEQLGGEREVEWNVHAGTVEYLRDGWRHDRFAYSTTPVDATSFELFFELEGAPLSMLIRKTKTGFCRAYTGDAAPPGNSPSFSDCYKRSTNRAAVRDSTVVMELALLNDGSIIVDGESTDVPGLRSALARLKADHGSVLFYLEDPGEAPPSPNAMEVSQALMRVPYRISTAPDFSTVLLPNGTVSDREQERRAEEAD